ncbi:MAG: hypothetical protein JWN65_1188 [Solirubrobacterales bacterium]|jgi:putative membrane protein|nr:hypothetical protein [Solirubrobacterales bacterium]
MLRRALAPVVVFAVTLTLGLGGAALAGAAGRQSAGQGRSQHAQRSDGACGSHRFSAWDAAWLKMSIQGDLFEIQGGQLAQQQAATQPAKDLGARLVKDHTKMLKDATAIAHRLGIGVPGKPSESQQWELRAVQQFQGRTFDKWYADLEVQDHIQDISEAHDEVTDGCNRAIRDDARSEIPVLQEHLKLARAVLASVS